MQEINKSKLSWCKKPEVLIPLLIAFISIPWWPNLFSLVDTNETKNDVSTSITSNASSTKQITAYLPFSIFYLEKELNNSSRTSIEIEENFKKYIGMVALNNTGYIKDVSKITEDKILVRLTEKIGDFDHIKCFFNQNSLKTVATLKIGQEIKFSGTISPEFIPFLKLEKCELQ